MSIAPIVVALGVSASLASGAQMHGAWSASTNTGLNFAGTWTAEAHQESGGVTGTWTLAGPGGKVLASGVWSASKAPKAWNGAWRAMISGGGEYSGIWTATTALAPE